MQPLRELSKKHTFCGSTWLSGKRTSYPRTHGPQGLAPAASPGSCLASDLLGLHVPSSSASFRSPVMPSLLSGAFAQAVPSVWHLLPVRLCPFSWLSLPDSWPNLASSLFTHPFLGAMRSTPPTQLPLLDLLKTTRTCLHWGDLGSNPALHASLHTLGR